MKLVLNIYEDETLSKVKRVAEADKVKIPYRVSMFILQSLENVNLKTQDDLFKFVVGATDKLDKIIKATFGVSENELDCIDTAELIPVAMELYDWAMEKINTLAGKDSKNAQTAAEKI